MGMIPVHPERAGKLFQVYAKAFHGRRQLYWSNGLRKLLELAQEQTDDELIAQAEDEQASVLATLTVKQWRAIRRYHQEAHLLTVAEDAPGLLQSIIDRLVTKDAAAPWLTLRGRRTGERSSEEDDDGG